MANLYNRLQELCQERQITGYKMCKDNSVSVNLMTELKAQRKKSISAEVAARLASYFDVSVDYLLGNSDVKKEKDPATNGDEVNSLEVSDFERDVIMLLRSIPEERKEAFVALLRSLQP